MIIFSNGDISHEKITILKDGIPKDDFIYLGANIETFTVMFEDIPNNDINMRYFYCDGVRQLLDKYGVYARFVLLTIDKRITVHDFNSIHQVKITWLVQRSNFCSRL